MIDIRILNALTSPFARLWRGQQSLSKAFWLFFIFGTFAALLLVMVASIPFILIDQPLAGYPIAIAGTIIYPLFAAVGVWRSANNRPFNRWPVAAAAAKMGVIFWLVVLMGRATGITSFAALESLFGSN